MRRIPKRLKTGDEPNGEAVKVKVRVKVKIESDDDKEEEEEEEKSLDNDDDEEEEEQVAQPVAQVERPGYILALRPYVPPRPNYILMDYDKSMEDEVIPDNKVIRPVNRWCFTKLDPVRGENSIDRCPTYGVCRVCCGSGPTGRHCHICENKYVIYVRMTIVLKTTEVRRSPEWLTRNRYCAFLKQPTLTLKQTEYKSHIA
jgi:hypothetical protein